MWDVRPGDKVTLNKNFVSPRQEGVKSPRHAAVVPDVVYTVRDVEGDCWSGPVLGFLPGIRLIELVNDPQWLHMRGASQPPEWVEPFYILAAFIKVVDHRGMETLRSILTEPNKKISGWHSSDQRPRVVKKEKTK